MDAGGLIAVERRDRRVRVLLDEAERAGWTVAVPVGPLAQVWRGGPRQALLARFLSASDHVDIGSMHPWCSAPGSAGTGSSRRIPVTSPPSTPG